MRARSRHRGSVTISGGALKGRVLAYPVGRTTRPTSARTRISLFDTLGAIVRDAVFADLYAGAGAVGIEALSRGAGFVHFVERDADAMAHLRRNLDATGVTPSRWRLHAGAVSTLAGGMADALADAEVVFADPPYDTDAGEELFERAGVQRLPHLEWLVIEHRTGAVPQPPSELVVRHMRRLGDTTLTYMVPAGSQSEVTRDEGTLS
ncbi:MAG TPA: RsmD family RNA methyltransferase, partial [Candidatus Krumholzibacteria bacterium]|nr:RsmD family RNA methyltransferase [Candidatus Krumholzibacteria bacterium]